MTATRIHLLCTLFAVSLARLALAQPAEVKSPLSPEESLKYFQLDPLLSIELVAAEPEVIDPVAIRFDEDGRLWVAEMRDYPLGPIKKTDGKRTEKDAEPLSQIKILEDENGDGRFETATVFADKLLFVTGLQPWKGGVIVTLSGKVAYMKDTDGDGKADVNETWFTGFSESNSQLRANHPTFALDNHIYVANGLRGGMVVNHLKKLLASGGRKPPDTKDKESDDAPINISGMDFRFDPFTGDAEAVSGNGQFGLCFDDWGNRFVCSNRNPCQHVVIENRYLKKAPTVAIPSVIQDVAAFAENSRIYPISKFWTTSNLHEGQFTAACGVFIYRGDLLPQQFRGNVFTCDPTGNLIHREIMEAKGPTFTSKPAYEGKEFLASPDTWFRPISMELGPDGALYVVDMYRAVIEHPEWVPDELKNRPDERLGDDRGRIYRIVPRNRKQIAQIVPRKLSQATGEELVSLVEKANAWQRETGQRLLVERQDQAVAASIEQIVMNSNLPQARIHSNWTLAALGKLGINPVSHSFKDASAMVRRNAVILSDTYPEVGGQFMAYFGKLLDDPDRGVQFQNLLWCPGVAESPTDRKVARMVSENVSDGWLCRAFFLSSYRQSPDSARMIMTPDAPAKDVLADSRFQMLQEFARGQGSDNGERAAFFSLSAATKNLFSKRFTWAGVVGLDGLARGFASRGTSLSRELEGLDTQPELEKAVQRRVLELTDSEKNPDRELQKAAIGLLAYFPDSEDEIAKILNRSKEQDLKLQAVNALSRGRMTARLRMTEYWKDLINGYSIETPTIRQAILDGVLQRNERISLLLDSLESGSIKPTELDPVQTGRLLKHGDSIIRERAEKIFGSATPADRKKALEEYQSVLTMAGDAKRGHVSFAKNCATCHKIGETGVNVAPDISDSRTKTPAQILADIIQPNRAIDANYVAYNLLLADGTTASGILTSETSTSVTLKAAGAKVITVSRGEIEQLKSTGVSLMPEGIEKTIPPQEMADLIAFIKNWRYLDGRVPVK